MSQRKSLIVLLVVAAALAGLFAWRFLGGSGSGAAIDDSTRRAMERVAGRTPDDPALAAYLAEHDAESLTDQEIAALVAQYEREREAGAGEVERGAGLRPVDD